MGGILYQARVSGLIILITPLRPPRFCRKNSEQEGFILHCRGTHRFLKGVESEPCDTFSSQILRVPGSCINPPGKTNMSRPPIWPFAEAYYPGKHPHGLREAHWLPGGFCCIPYEYIICLICNISMNPNRGYLMCCVVVLLVRYRVQMRPILYKARGCWVQLQTEQYQHHNNNILLLHCFILM